MRRSRFVAAAGGGMLALALPSPPRRALAGDAVDYTLTAAPLRMSPMTGVSFDALAYNGSVPGPVLRVQNGQRMRVKYVNRTGVSTTVHWHGMILPNGMDGAAGVTQSSVPDGGTFLYEFAAGPPGTRWYHDHDMNMGLARGLFGMIVVEDPRDDRPDAEFALVFHDIPNMRTFDQALRGVSTAPMVDPLGSPELLGMRADDKMSDEVAYVAHCVNGASYPHTSPLKVKVGQRVRLRILNANLTQTRYLRLAGHRLRVTHADGNPLQKPLEVNALRIGVAERYDAWFEVTQPGAWLLQGLSSEPLAFEQATVIHTDGMEQATPHGSPQSLDGVDYFTYEKAAGVAASGFDQTAQIRKKLVLSGGDYGSSKWTIDGKTWPDTDKIFVNRDDRVLVSFTNKADMEHPMHLHGHTFEIVEIGGKTLARPLAKDIALVPANGGTLTWRFDATSPPGRWLLHCHNDIHMTDGMMTEVVYRK